MTPRPDLVEIFAARIDAVLANAARNGATALPLDAVLVYPGHVREGTAEERAELVTAEWEASTAAGLRCSASANPATWPADLPLPLTLGDAIEAVKQRRADIAADLAAELERCARALVAPVLVDLVLSRDGVALAEDWPWPDGGAGGRALFALIKGAGIGDRDNARVGREMARGGGIASTFEIFGRQARNVARWAAPALNRLWPGFGTEALDMAERHGTMIGTSVLAGDGNAHRYPAGGMALLYHAERAELWRTRATFAAGEAYRAVHQLAGADHAGDAHFAAVDAALMDRAGEEPDPLAAVARTDQAKRSGYAGALLAWAGKVSRDLFPDDPPADEAAARATVTTTAGDALRWDAAFADLLERMRPNGKELADTLRADAAKRTAEVRTNAAEVGTLWGLWFELDPRNGSRWLRGGALAMWANEWRPALVIERRPVALPVAAMRGLVTGALSGVRVEPGADGRRVLVDRDGRAVARFEGPRLATAVQVEALEALALGGVRELATVAAMRFVPWFAHAVQRRADETAPLTFEGGEGVNAYGTVAGAMGMDPEKHAGAVRGLLHALNCTILSYPDGGEAGVLMLDYRPGKGGAGNRSRLTITPGRPWLWSDVYELPEGAEHRALAPIPMLPDLAPPFVGDRRERGPLGRLWLRILAELAREAPDLARGLGAHIPGARWAQLAREEGVLRPPPLLVTLIQDRWTRDGDDGPAVFERVGADRWHLAPAFDAERTLLEEGGKQRIGASIGGTLSVKAKREARERLAEGKGNRRRK